MTGKAKRKGNNLKPVVELLDSRILFSADIPLLFGALLDPSPLYNQPLSAEQMPGELVPPTDVSLAASNQTLPGSVLHNTADLQSYVPESDSAVINDIDTSLPDSPQRNTAAEPGAIQVRAANEVPVFVDSGPYSVDEGAAATTLVGNVNANNGDGGAADAGITYSITSNVNPDSDGDNAFAINSSSGRITVNDAGDLDFEGTTPLVITVQADDGVHQSSTTGQLTLMMFRQH